MKNDDELKLNWTMLGIISIGIGFWISVWFNGIFVSLMGLIITGAIVGLWLRLTGRA